MRAALLVGSLGLGCTETAKPSPVTAPSAATAANRHEDEATIECVEVLEYPGDVGGTTRRKRGIWSAAERTYTELESDALNAAPSLRWLYRSDGQITAYVGVAAPFQHDYAYDGHGNAIDFFLSYPAQSNVQQRSTAAPWIGRRHINEYDATGRLVASTTADYGAGNTDGKTVKYTFAEDASGRCVTMTGDDGSRSSFGYDAAGRLTKTEIQDLLRQETQVTTFDDRGRPLTWTQTLVGRRSFVSGTSTMTHQYLPDGSEVVDVHDGLTDVGSGHLVRRRSAGCLRIDVARGHLADTRCHVGG